MVRSVTPPHSRFGKAFNRDTKVSACLIQDLIGRQDMQLVAVSGRKVKCIQRTQCCRPLGHPLTRPENVGILNRHHVVQPPITVVSKQLLHPLCIFVRQLVTAHLLCERGVQLYIREPADYGRIECPNPTLGLFAKRLRAVVRYQDTCVDVGGQYRSSVRCC